MRAAAITVSDSTLASPRNASAVAVTTLSSRVLPPTQRKDRRNRAGSLPLPSRLLSPFRIWIPASPAPARLPHHTRSPPANRTRALRRGLRGDPWTSGCRRPFLIRDSTGRFGDNCPQARLDATESDLPIRTGGDSFTSTRIPTMESVLLREEEPLMCREAPDHRRSR